MSSQRMFTRKEDWYAIAGLIVAALGCLAAWLALPQAQKYIESHTVGARQGPEVQQGAEQGSELQLVSWLPSDPLRGTGMCIGDCSEFIPWYQLRGEIERNLLPQVAEIPHGSRVRLNDFNGKRDWIIEVADPNGTKVGDVWLGSNPKTQWRHDGFARVGKAGASPEVWAVFQRRSGGTYEEK